VGRLWIANRSRSDPAAVFRTNHGGVAVAPADGPVIVD
jgi:hypothetical protein